MRQIFIFIFAIIVAQTSNAGQTTNNASIKINNDNLVVTPLRELNFGKVLAPETGVNLVRVQRDGLYHSTTTGTLGNFQTSARYQISGTASETIVYTEIDSSSTIPGVFFDRLYYPATQVLSAGGNRFVTIGGRIFVGPAAVPGVYNNGELTYTFSVEYQ